MWPSARIGEAVLEQGASAVRARQLAARHRQDARGIDPAKLPGQLFAGTFDSAVELLQIGEDHARACTGRLGPEARGCTTAGLVGCINLFCSLGDGCQWQVPSWHSRASAGASAGKVRWTSVRVCVSGSSFVCIVSHFILSIRFFQFFPHSSNVACPMYVRLRSTKAATTTGRTTRVAGLPPHAQTGSLICTRR
eukprot:SAG22_NODE_363_length_11694_cov_40.815783_4_plen_194_part_00